MPAASTKPPDPSSSSADPDPAIPRTLPFPPLTKSHILACSFPTWYPLFRPHTPKARLIPLPASFTAYLRADGILLPPSHPSTPRGAASSPTTRAAQDDDEGFFSSSQLSSAAEDSDDSFSDDGDDVVEDPSAAWPETHAKVGEIIAELGGAVVPKLNWSAPKDATWISATNSLECRSANEVYLLLKGSDFVTHDLEHAFDGCVDFPGRTGIGGDAEQEDSGQEMANVQRIQTEDASDKLTSADKVALLEKEIDFTLVLRKFFRLNPSLEFRVFVRRKNIMGMGQRDLNHYDFLFPLRPKLKTLIVGFWEREIKDRFDQENYTFDVYVPPPHDRVWIVDFNPWDVRTDPGLWSWLELLTMEDPEPTQREEKGIRFRIGSGGDSNGVSSSDARNGSGNIDSADEDDSEVSEDEDSDDDEDVEILYDTPGPEFRLVQRDDPEAYMFNSTRYSAHKLPRDVVDASQSGAGGLREFAEQWKDILEKKSRDANLESDGDDD